MTGQVGRKTSVSSVAGIALSRRHVLGGMTASGALSASQTSPVVAKNAGHPDFVVVGAGVFGAWTAWTLQRRSHNVLLIDAWGPAHSRSSSGGETRLIRTEYAAEPLYTRWAWESLAEWKALDRRCDNPIFRETGALYMYSEGSAKIDESIAIQRALDIPIEKLNSAEMASRWPQINFEGVAAGVLQPTMGALMARRSVQMLVDEFVKAGGRYRQIAIAPPQSDGEVLKALSGAGGEILEAGRFIFACGPWLAKLFSKVVGERIVPTRQNVFYFAPQAGDERFASPHMPSWVDVSSPDLHYGFPDIESRGFKIALDRHGPVVDPDRNDRLVADDALTAVRAYLARRFPPLAGRPLAETRVCQYENTDTGNFLIDRHPDWANVWIVGGGTGHGFKHGPAIGRYVSDLVLGTGEANPRFALTSHKIQDR